MRVREDFLPFSPPNLGEEEIAEVVDTLRSGWITTGPKTKRFEKEFASAVEAPAALALSSCTAGLHLSLLHHGIGPGDEVITSTMTFAATANMVEVVGATPILVDVEPDTLNLDPAAVQAAVTPRTKAIMPVHYAGHPVEVDAIQAIADEHDLAVIEDAAHSLPASYRGRKIGSSQNLTAFSFYATKNLTTAEGGMLTGPAEILDRIRVSSLHGLSRDGAGGDAWQRYGKGGTWYYDVAHPGYKFNMTDIQAAIGIQQLKKLPGFQVRRREVFNQYCEAFRDVPSLETPAPRPEVESALHLFVLRLVPDRLKIDRAAFIEELAARNVGTSVHFIPLHIHPFYRDKYGLTPEQFPVAQAAFERILSLPLHPGLTPENVEYIVEAVREVAAIHAA